MPTIQVRFSDFQYDKRLPDRPPALFILSFWLVFFTDNFASPGLISNSNHTMHVRDGGLDMALASKAAYPLLETLPPELRNQIYEYVFTSERSTRRDIYAAVRKRPLSNLLLTCQRMFAEANGIYELAQTSYWRENTFYIDLLGKNMFTRTSAHRTVDNLHDRDLDLIRRIIISYDYGSRRREWRLTTREDIMKGWFATIPLANDSKVLPSVGKRTG